MAMQYPNCGRCGKPVGVNIEQPSLNNQELFSTVVITHSGETLCACGAVLQVIIGGIKVDFMLAVVPPEHQKRMVQAPVSTLKI